MFSDDTTRIANLVNFLLRIFAWNARLTKGRKGRLVVAGIGISTDYVGGMLNHLRDSEGRLG